MRSENGSEPARLEPEDVVAEPEVIGRVALAQQPDLGDDVVGRPRVVRVPVDRLRAPVALVGAAARRVHVEREVAVARAPERAVAIDVDEIPRRRAAARPAPSAARAGRSCAASQRSQTRPGMTSSPAGTSGGCGSRRASQLAQGELAFADDDEVGAGVPNKHPARRRHHARRRSRARRPRAPPRSCPAPPRACGPGTSS